MPYGKLNSDYAYDPSFDPYLPLPIYSMNLWVNSLIITILLFAESAIIKLPLTIIILPG